MCSQFLPALRPSSCSSFETAANLMWVKNAVDKTSGIKKGPYLLASKINLKWPEAFYYTTNKHVSVCLNSVKSDFCVSTLVSEGRWGLGNSREVGRGTRIIWTFLFDPFRLQSHIWFELIPVDAAADSISPHPSHILLPLGLGGLLAEFSGGADPN